MDKAVDCLRQVHETRFNGMDAAIKLLQEETNRRPGLIHDEVEQLGKIVDERFHRLAEQFSGVSQRFADVEKLTNKIADLNALAIAAALQAAKEVVGENNKANALANNKSEAMTKEKLEQLSVIFNQSNRVSDERTNSIKERLDRNEGMRSAVIIISTLVIAAVGVVVAVVFHH